MINTVRKYLKTYAKNTGIPQVFSLFPLSLYIFGILMIFILGRLPYVCQTMVTSGLFYNHRIFADAPEPWQYGFQDPATPVMEGIVDLHHDICFFLILIIVFVLWMLSRTV